MLKMKFGLQHPNFSFDYKNEDTSQIVGSLKESHLDSGECWL